MIELVGWFLSSEANVFDFFFLVVIRGVNDGTLWTVGRYCPNLEALDISELDRLTDASLREITDGCRSLNSVKFKRNRFRFAQVSQFVFFNVTSVDCC